MSKSSDTKTDEPKVDEVEFCSVRPEEVPPVPENKFLKRRTDGPTNGQMERKRSRSRESYRDAAGRKVKGRGVLRYTGRSRSRSRTPPLWRRVAHERKHQPEHFNREKSFRNYDNFVREKRHRRPSPTRKDRSKSRDQNRKSRSLSPKIDKSRERSREKKRSVSHEKTKDETRKIDDDKLIDKEKLVDKRSNSKEKNRTAKSQNSSRDKYSRSSRRKKSRSKRSSSSSSQSSRSRSRDKSNRHRRSKD